ncbi:diphosphomevalonate/mevalonate 3,5-bisphosphate decarboxylase family protein [Legionella sp. CNM-1927-20]|uniref:diphosphomevalonate/mevalonate 3,5-bisphosphate decarboxylase family protein n=1 Tax=Legionella sp. CNM-1927-20 TaxID=3422221 RepID=UPI00403ABDE8
MQWFAQAPANIALIKYMGKKDDAHNIPANPSLSYTLNNLLTSVTLETQPGKKDFWEPLHIPGALPFTLSEPAQARFLKHLDFLKQHFGYTGSFIVRSSNNFPHGSGLASSASSFAALTICAVRALCDCLKIPLPSVLEQAQLSRLGSGSSCRSFFSPWALWEEENVSNIELPYTKFYHQVIIISHQEKDVPSSQAHQLVKTSPLYQERPERARQNLNALIEAFKAKVWEKAFEICWQEFQDMHQLFITCDNPFTYITDNTKLVLKNLQTLWDQHGDGPIVTMDAGPNIHLLYRPEQTEMALQFKRDYLVGNYDVL